MNNSTFSRELDTWIRHNPFELVSNIPSGSGVFRLIDIPAEQYSTGFVSTAPGSFKSACDSGNWAGTDLKTCFAEAHPKGTPVYEVTKFNQDTPVLNVYNLPEIFQKAIYLDKELPPSDKFIKSHIVLSIAEKYMIKNSYSGIYFPSRRAPDGGVFVYNPKTLPSVTIAYTGVNPPPSGVVDWL